MTGSQLLEWQVFTDLDPEPGVRADYANAHVVQALIRNGKPLQDFMLRYGDEVPTSAPAQDLAFQEMIIDGWISAHNASFAKKGT